MKRSRYAHQVTACSLYHLLTEAYTESLASDFEEFSSEKDHVPQFNFWFITLSLELLLFTFVRSLREENFQLYTKMLCKMAPWFFALDRINYSRWLPVHIRDMQILSITHPDVFQNYMEGKFVIHNSERKFSGISIDQGIERQDLNRVVIHTVDTDVVVLGISAISQRDALKLFIAFGTQKNFRYININDLAIFLGNEKSKVLPIFHTFTGCDTVSFFAGNGYMVSLRKFDSSPIKSCTRS